MTYITREQWRARPPSGSRNALDPKPRGSGVHWNGPGCAAAIRTHDKCPGFLRGIQDFHMGPSRGWSDIAYSLFVCPHGDVFEGRGKGVGTAAFGTNHGNRYYYAIYAMWGKGDGPAPDAMLDGITEAVALCRSWGAGQDVIGHRDENKGTECPGDELHALVHAGRFDKPTTPTPAQKDEIDMATTDELRTIIREEIARALSDDRVKLSKATASEIGLSSMTRDGIAQTVMRMTSQDRGTGSKTHRTVKEIAKEIDS